MLLFNLLFRRNVQCLHCQIQTRFWIQIVKYGSMGRNLPFAFLPPRRAPDICTFMSNVIGCYDFRYGEIISNHYAATILNLNENIQLSLYAFYAAALCSHLAIFNCGLISKIQPCGYMGVSCSNRLVRTQAYLALIYCPLVGPSQNRISF